MSTKDLLAKVDADLAQGHTFLAGQRLASLTSAYPDDLDIRAKRAQVAKRVGNFAEAGRWGYLTEEVDSSDLAAFEKMFKRPRMQLLALKLGTSPAGRLGPRASRRFGDLLDRARADTTDHQTPFAEPEPAGRRNWLDSLAAVGCGVLMTAGVLTIAGLAVYGFLALFDLI